jgi:hypothetical protein
LLSGGHVPCRWSAHRAPRLRPCQGSVAKLRSFTHIPIAETNTEPYLGPDAQDGLTACIPVG